MNIATGNKRVKKKLQLEGPLIRRLIQRCRGTYEKDKLFVG